MNGGTGGLGKEENLRSTIEEIVERHHRKCPKGTRSTEEEEEKEGGGIEEEDDEGEEDGDEEEKEEYYLMRCNQ